MDTYGTFEIFLAEEKKKEDVHEKTPQRKGGKKLVHAQSWLSFRLYLYFRFGIGYWCGENKE